jgi:transposase
MEKSTKFVKPLTEEQRELLEEITKIHALPEQRKRAHAILLSDQRYSIDQIADLYKVDRHLVDNWLECWNEREFDGLGDVPNVFTIKPSPKLHGKLREQSLNRLRAQNEARRMADNPPRIRTLNDKPGKYTAQDIIEYLDDIEHITPFSFIDIGHPYIYTADSRLTLFADETRWAIVFEKSGHNPRASRIELYLNYFGNCLGNLKPIANSDRFYNSQTFVLIDQSELIRIGGDTKVSTDGNEVTLGVEVRLRERYVKTPDTKQDYQKWIPDIMTRDYPEYVYFRDLVRYLAYEYEELCRATDEELRYCIPHDLPKIMVIDQWYHKS